MWAMVLARHQGYWRPNHSNGSKVKISTGPVEHRKSFNVVWVWSDMYRDCGGYISTGVREVWSKETDRCPLTQVLYRIPLFAYILTSDFSWLDPK
jgi:hypothetical protein